MIPWLADSYCVVAPDLLGHGASAKPRGDYSIGAHANGIRDLLEALGHRHATVVGHSLGGGIATQFAYQFPERCQRLVLVSSGGLGRELHGILRAATLPGAELVMPLLCAAGIRDAVEGAADCSVGSGCERGPNLEETWRGFSSFADAEALQAFIHTLRTIVDAGGQRVAPPTDSTWPPRSRR